MKLTNVHLAVAAALSGACVVVPTHQALAQQEGLEEIVVTATRRAQDLQDVPVSIVAITGDKLELQGLDSLEDVGQFTPNINIIGGGAGTFGPTFRVRGLPNIGLYVDGVWQINTSGFLTSDFVDVDRIEVLRGPQGTTYGRDAVGGAIRIWTQRPRDEFGGTITATTGSYDRRDIKASIDLPITDKLKTKWTASSLYRDGYINSISAGQKYGLSDQDVYRGDILWEPTDRLSFRVTYTNDTNKLTEPRIQDAIFDTRVIPGPDGVVGTADDIQNWGVLMRDFYGLAIEANPTRYAGYLPYTPENYTSGYPGGRLGKWETASSVAIPSRIHREQTTVDISWDITDSITLDALSAYQDIATDIVIDWDGSEYHIVGDLSRTRGDVFSEELQLSGGGDRINWVAGLYYWDQSAVTRADRRTLGDFFTYPGGPPDPAFRFEDAYASQLCQDLLDPTINTTGAATCQFAAGFAAGPFAYDRLNFAEQDGWAVFGEATISLTDRLDLTVGVRHHDQNVNNGPMAFIPGVTAPQTPSEDVLHVGGDPWAGTRIINPDAPPVSFDKNTYKAALQMRFTDDIMGYISFSQGFNSGGIDSVTLNAQGGGSQQLWFPYEPETIENREIGMRADLAGGRLRLNATYFDSDWNDIQNDGVVHDPQSGVELPTLATTNVGTANASGLELELTVVPTDKLTLNFNAGFLSTGYTYLAPGTDVLTLDTEFEQAPDETYSAGLQYVADMSNGGSLTTRFDYAHSSQFWRSLPFLRLDWYGAKNGGPVPAGYDEAGSYGILNARISYEPPSRAYTVAVFGTNLTDEYVLDSGFFHGIWGYDFATVGRPRELGASLMFRF
jgi:iron complex outermembrane receptor protein